jgi:hypothetical protein
MARTRLEAFADELVQDQLANIDEALEDLNKKLEVFDRIRVKRDQLMSARRALLGVGNRQTGSGGTKITQDEVAQAMNGNGDGMTTQEIVSACPGSTDAIIRGHLSRGKGERFLKRESDGKWFLRDPENGINEADDLPEEDD